MRGHRDHTCSFGDVTGESLTAAVAHEHLAENDESSIDERIVKG